LIWSLYPFGQKFLEPIDPRSTKEILKRPHFVQLPHQRLRKKPCLEGHVTMPQLGLPWLRRLLWYALKKSQAATIISTDFHVFLTYQPIFTHSGDINALLDV
jgi:hypothetical protein